MAYVIAEPCIGTKDAACVDACPVDCIHPKKDETGYSDAKQATICPRNGRSTPTRTPSTLADSFRVLHCRDAQPPGCAFYFLHPRIPL